MALVKKTVFAPIAQQATAVSLSVVNGQASCTFAGRAEDSLSSDPAPQFCVSSGQIEDTVAAAFVSAGYLLSDFTGRNVSLAFEEFDLVPWSA